MANEVAEIDGVKYDLNEDDTASIRILKNNLDYLEIPDHITVDGKDYDVVSFSGTPDPVQTVFLKAGVIKKAKARGRNDRLMLCCPAVNFEVDPEDPDYKSVEGVIYSKKGNILSKYPRMRPPQAFTVPMGVSKIAPRAFEYSLVAAVKYENDSSIIDIGGWAFAYCNILCDFTVPSNVRRLGPEAFDGCSRLTDFNFNTMLSECVNVIDNCNALTYVQFPKTSRLTKLAIEGCRGLTTLKAPQGLKCLILENCSGFETLDLEGSQVETLIVKNCRSFYSARIPSSVKKFSFEGCTYLQEFGCEKGFAANEIPNGAFAGCISLEKIEIPASIENIRGKAFENCRSLMEVTFEKGSALKKIAPGAFKDSPRLEQVVLPDGSLYKL